MICVPIFPLHAVLFPGGMLPLRIFEARYIDMVSECLQTGNGFGVCLIRQGSEVGTAALSHDIGTLATITDWERRPDGLLGITVRGDRRFRIQSRMVAQNHLIRAEVEWIPNEPSQELPDAYQPIALLLRNIVKQLPLPYSSAPQLYRDAVWVGYRLAELLPIAPHEKQLLLQLNDTSQRLKHLQTFAKALNLA
ncbi:MAG: LON peptidase substrate-binding domain-containing protein [Gammaproteobacteria bacterium]|nr:LON peptidase substrate-binding domain-containing protein [Gammaproteobacteria bacterium]